MAAMQSLPRLRLWHFLVLQVSVLAWVRPFTEAVDWMHGDLEQGFDDLGASLGMDADFVPHGSGSGKHNDSEGLEVSLLLLFFLLVLALGVFCSLYSVCVQIKCPGTTNAESGHSFEAMLTRRPSYFREDLLNDDELLRLWICFYCDFANYEVKTHCALCGNDKREKDMPTTPRSKVQSIRPASLFASMATTLSSSRSMSPSFLTNGSPGALGASLSPGGAVGSLSAGGAMQSPPMTPPSIVTSAVLAALPSPSAGMPLPMPSSPSGTPYAMLQRRKEWKPVLDGSGNVVWEHQGSSNCGSNDAREDQAIYNSEAISAATAIPDDIVVATAFVTHNIISPAHPHGKLDFVAAEGAQVYGSSRPEYYNAHSDYLFLDPLAIETVRAMSFPEKHRWFMQETTAILHVRWENPTVGSSKHDVTLVVPRDDLFHGTMRGLLAASPRQLHSPLRVRFKNEPGVDAGGIVREWFGLAMQAFLDEANGLFQPMAPSSGGIGDGNQACTYTIHPSASIVVPDHLLYFRAFGRLLGKALLEGHLVPVALSDVLLKHLLSVPVSFADLHARDDKLARSLRLLWETPLDDPDDEDDDPYALDFSVYHTTMGVVDLKPGGRDVVVSEANKREYVALFTQWQLGQCMAEEVAALVSGLYDVLPCHLLAPFDYQELRLLLCGSPRGIDVDDWQQHTLVLGKKAARVVHWFWRCVRALSETERCKLLQFATGATRVPLQGFAALTSSDGRLCPFTLHCLPRDDCPCPRAYTCFNRLDLPLYRSQQELEDALRLVLQMDVTGFSIQ